MIAKPQPLEIKRLYILLALSRTPMHPYGIRQQALEDSNQALVLSLATLRNILAELTRRQLVDITGVHHQGSRNVYLYHITELGRRRLRSEYTNLERAIALAKRYVP